MARTLKTTQRAVWIAASAAMLLAVSLVGASFVGAPPLIGHETFRPDAAATKTLRELNRLGILRRATEPAVEQLLTHQRRTGKSLAQLLKEPFWVSRLGLSAVRFKSTWYAANPFDMLPKDLQAAIRQRKEPLRGRSDLERLVRELDGPSYWRSAIRYALVETTASNLWRAARGLRPFTKNGQFLEPIVVEKGGGVYDVRDGHIATDPKEIPTGTTVLMVVRIGGKDRLLRVKATDIGHAVRGRHVDLPIHIRPKKSADPGAPIRFPKEYIRNASVLILMPGRSVNRGQTAEAAGPSRLPS